VLAIQYYPLSSSNYYNQINVATAYTADDYPTQFSTTANTSPQDLATTVLTSGQSSPPNSSSYAPIDIGLRACASSTSDFFYATGASSISNAINTMLRSALASTIRLSN
jgi:D-serine deaminase-like pyridoxal phosphate-dependent protein